MAGTPPGSSNSTLAAAKVMCSRMAGIHGNAVADRTTGCCEWQRQQVGERRPLAQVPPR